MRDIVKKIYQNMNKVTDMLYDELKAEIKAELPKGVDALFISSVAEIGLQELKDKLWDMLN